MNQGNKTHYFNITKKTIKNKQWPKRVLKYEP